jgi:Protein of unknown function (DUF2721)
MDPNPFAALSLIVAPAILTNASSVLSMSTSNRLARAVDRARELSRQLEAAEGSGGPAGGEDAREFERRLHELTATEERAIMLLHVLQSFYVALGGFAMATFASLLGAVVAPLGTGVGITALELLAVTAGMVGVGGMVRGSAILIRETSIAVRVVTERAASVRARARLQ